MANPFGLLIPAATIGLGSVMFKAKRGFFPFNDEGEALAPIVAQATVEEVHDDELTLTRHPIEQGASITDHAYKEPSEVIVRCGWSNSPSGPSGLIGAAVGLASTLPGAVGRIAGIAAALPGTIQAAQSLLSGNAQDQVRAIYKQLLDLQTSRVPFDLYTGKRVYRNMAFKRLRTETTEQTENSMIITAHCTELLIVSTSIAAVPASAQADPSKTNPPTDFGPKSLLTNPSSFITPNLPRLVVKLGGL